MTVELRILESRTGAGFRVQYRRRFLLWTYWSDTGHVRLQGRVLPVVYPTREMAEAEPPAPPQVQLEVTGCRSEST